MPRRLARGGPPLRRSIPADGLGVGVQLAAVLHLHELDRGTDDQLAVRVDVDVRRGGGHVLPRRGRARHAGGHLVLRGGLLGRYGRGGARLCGSLLGRLGGRRRVLGRLARGLRRRGGCGGHGGGRRSGGRRRRRRAPGGRRRRGRRGGGRSGRRAVRGRGRRPRARRARGGRRGRGRRRRRGRGDRRLAEREGAAQGVRAHDQADQQQGGPDAALESRAHGGPSEWSDRSSCAAGPADAGTGRPVTA